MRPIASLTLSGLRTRAPAAPWRPVCAQCHRSLTSSPVVASGHNRWSKIRHGKGAADAKKTALRSSFTKTLTLFSQMYGPDIGMNPQLAATVNQAKKAGVPKAVIEAAIARGQGRSADGASLETATYEIMMAPAVALILDLETESKARATQDLNALIKKRGGQLKSTRFLFTRRGRVIFMPPDDDDASSSNNAAAATDTPPVSADDILEDAIEAGAEDVETDDDNIIVWTPANQTAPVVNAITAGPFQGRLAVESAETIWAANEDTRSPLAAKGDDMRKLTELVAALRAYPDVRAIYSNATQGEVSDEAWQQLAQDLDW